MHRNEPPLRPAWVEIDTEALRRNFRAIKARAEENAAGNPVAVAAVVKANAYGHGSVEVSRILLEEGAAILAVATVLEGLELREAGISAPIMVLGLTTEDTFPAALEAGLILPVSGLQQAETLAAAARSMGGRADGAAADSKSGAADGAARSAFGGAPYFLALDTGMSRIGLPAGEAGLEEARAILSLEGICCMGIFSHLAAADEADPSYTQLQSQRFRRFTDALKADGLCPRILSLSNSAAIMDHPGIAFDLCRPGIILYGHYPSEEVNKDVLALQPAMSVKSRITHLKTVPAGTAVSYGCTFVTERETVLATIPVGYADGYPRLLSNKGQILVNGQFAPIVGRVCMDQFMADVTHIPGVKAGDEAVLLGTQGENRISAEDIAALTGTINYEVLCDFGLRLKRIYK
ncbi:MAG: alanine racemase [Clostridiales bacterium]|nr:alanine racemase [Clostridiales bacterium]